MTINYSASRIRSCVRSIVKRDQRQIEFVAYRDVATAIAFLLVHVDWRHCVLTVLRGKLHYCGYEKGNPETVETLGYYGPLTGGNINCYCS